MFRAMSKIGFIGLGTMGRPMARSLLRAGHELYFYSRRNDVAEELVALGGSRAATPALVARASEFIITIVTADEAVRDVVLGTDGVVEAATPGKLLLEMSTIAPATAREIAVALAQRGMGMLDAPVSGGPTGAEAASLTIMAGGSEPDFAVARPVLACLGKNIFHLGPVGAGQTVKLINQLLGGSMMALIGEAFALARASGIDLEQMVEVIRCSSGNSAVFESRARNYVLRNAFPPAFTTYLMRKDLLLALDLAAGWNVPLPVTAAVVQQYTAAMNLGHRGDDFSAVAAVCSQLAGLLPVTRIASDREQQR